jgi:peptidoglycan/xylan/chitin deacetylase (PgdA/CDA1 family)
VKGWLKSAVRLALHQGPGLAVVRWRYNSALRILMYHRFPNTRASVTGFEDQCRHIRQHYTPVSMDTVAKWLHQGEPLPPRALTITVDDGHADFYERALPVLSRYGIPSMVYLFTGFIDGTEWPWWDRITYVSERTRVESVAIPGGSRCLRLKDDPHELMEALKKLPDVSLRDFLEQLPHVAGVSIPETTPEAHRPMTWDEIRKASAQGVAFGAHTHTHPILSRVNHAGMVEEIDRSRARIGDELGSYPIHFCYPNGRPEDIPAGVDDVLRARGFQTAVTTTIALASAGVDPFALPRLPVTPGDSPDYIHELIAGCYQEPGRGIAVPAK